MYNDKETLCELKPFQFECYSHETSEIVSQLKIDALYHKTELPWKDRFPADICSAFNMQIKEACKQLDLKFMQYVKI